MVKTISVSQQAYEKIIGTKVKKGYKKIEYAVDYLLGISEAGKIDIEKILRDSVTKNK